MKRQPMVVSWILAWREKAVSAFGITRGARLMHSMPPDTSWGLAGLDGARGVITASMSEPQRRFIVVPGTQLTNVAVGQGGDITVDGLSGAYFTGRVERISPASGSQFALLPPDNATGNFTKVVQRIPVRIALGADQPELDRLRPGMSVIASIRTAMPVSSVATR